MKALNKVLRTPSLLAAAAAVLLLASTGLARTHERNSSYCMANPAVSQYAELLPQPVGGYESIMSKIEYPQVALKASLEGDVLAKISVGDNGNVEDVKLLKELGGGCDEAVIKAIKDTKFKYAAPEDSPRVKEITVLFRFELHNN